MNEFDELYDDIYKLAQKRNLTVPFLFKPYVTARKTVDKNLWCASAEGKNGNYKVLFNGYGNTQIDAMRELKKKLLEGYNE